MTESAGIPTPSSEPASRPWLWPAIVAAIAVAAIVIGLLVTGGDDSDSAPATSAAPATSTSSPEPVTTDTEAVQPTSTSAASTSTTTGDDGETTACPEFTENLTLPLRLCDQGAAVQMMQENLTLAGFEASADGLFGPATEQSVIGFQTSVGLQADGIYGPDTSAAMDAALGTDDT